jgi:hypothetical protein
VLCVLSIYKYTKYVFKKNQSEWTLPHIFSKICTMTRNELTRYEINEVKYVIYFCFLPLKITKLLWRCIFSEQNKEWKKEMKQNNTNILILIFINRFNLIWTSIISSTEITSRTIKSFSAFINIKPGVNFKSWIGTYLVIVSCNLWLLLMFLAQKLSKV